MMLDAPDLTKPMSPSEGVSDGEMPWEKGSYKAWYASLTPRGRLKLARDGWVPEDDERYVSREPAAEMTAEETRARYAEFLKRVGLPEGIQVGKQGVGP
jgi:hypothetical protein